MPWGQAHFREPIVLIVPYGAGGERYLRPYTGRGSGKERLLPKPLIVENKPGGSGAIGFAYVASKKKDPTFSSRPSRAS